MSCDCLKQPSTIKIDRTIHQPSPDFEIVERVNWEALIRCRDCGQYWKVDDWDKYQIQLAMKVDGPQHWNAPDVERRKAFLIESRGGFELEQCGWLNCVNPRLKDGPYCADHLYAAGSRE